MLKAILLLLVGPASFLPQHIAFRSGRAQNVTLMGPRMYVMGLHGRLILRMRRTSFNLRKKTICTTLELRDGAPLEQGR